MKLSTSKPKKSLTRQTLTQMGWRISAVIVFFTTVSYFHLVSSLTSETLDRLAKYITERGQRERTLFALAEDNHKLLKQALLEQLKAEADRDPKAEFDRNFVKYPDGSIRNRPELFQIDKTGGLFLGKNVNVNTEMQRRIVAFYKTINAYGPAWRNRFANTYTQIPENGMIMYMHQYPWSLKAPSSESFRVTDDESFQITRPIHDPERKTVWTGIYYDQVAVAWMASCVTPLDVDGKHIATIGHDILIDDLQKRTLNEGLKGTYNMIFRADGRLVAHPDKMDQIHKEAGFFNILKSDDRHLQRIFEQVKKRNPNQVIIDNSQDKEFLAVAKLDEPDWYLVTVLPKAIVTKSATEAARFVLIIGFISLLIEVIILFYVLRDQVAAPISQLMYATQKITNGDFSTTDNQRDDEIGELAKSFNSMARQLQEAFETLEDKVKERTAELGTANEEIIALNERLKEDNLRMGAELDIVRQMQQMILPNPDELEIDGLDIAGYMDAADEVGGDYYDVLNTDGVVTLGIGDVTGHGLESGILMLMAQTAVRTLKEIHETDPVRFLDALNRTLYKNVQRMKSEKSLTLAILNYSQGLVSISGQHEETIIVRNGGQVERIDTMDLGFPIALEDDIAEFISHISMELQLGDGIVLYTDGIPEAKDIKKKQYGVEAMCEVISKNWHLSAGEIKQAVIDDVRRHIGNQKVFDDITLLVLKRTELGVETESQPQAAALVESDRQYLKTIN
ncbi:SpoIIE family protein phosphatase [Microcoleus sp. D2_18a_D3]|uniref:SpoIIE family protein phosphatase n=1 Tax=Microcoleus sp. D2_18a_D3 TaxID=3055330 RepID=UPI002FD5B791